MELCDLSKDKLYTAKSIYNYKNFENKESFLNIEIDLTKEVLIFKTEDNNGDFIGLANELPTLNQRFRIGFPLLDRSLLYQKVKMLASFYRNKIK